MPDAKKRHDFKGLLVRLQSMLRLLESPTQLPVSRQQLKSDGLESLEQLEVLWSSFFENEKLQAKRQVVHIDDDLFLREAWKMSADEHEVSLISLSPEEAQTYNFEQLTSQTSFYIDWNLGENSPSGESLLYQLHTQGFEHLYISTGHEAAELGQIPYVKGVIGKSAPWEPQLL